eukprot:6678640-Prymnesium_polylepis.1
MARGVFPWGVVIVGTLHASLASASRMATGTASMSTLTEKNHSALGDQAAAQSHPAEREAVRQLQSATTCCSQMVRCAHALIAPLDSPAARTLVSLPWPS